MPPNRAAFDEAYARLNEEQRAGVEAVWQPSSSMVVLPAGAGAGKTASLVVALAGLHYHGICSPAQVIAVTFTRVGEAEMQERLSKLVPAGTFQRVLTYDKLVWRWLGSAGRSQIAGKARMRGYAFLGPLGSERPNSLGEVGTPAPDTLMKLIVCKDKQRDVPGLPGFRGLDFYDRWSDNPDERALIRSYAACREWVRSNGLFFEVPETRDAAFGEGIDRWANAYDGAISSSRDSYVQAIMKFEEAKQRLGTIERLDPMFWYAALGRDPVKRFLVDEAQDNTRLQVNIARDKAAQGDGTCVLIGDVRQSIFGFRAAAPDILASAIRDPEAVVRPLRSNYRSLPRIVRSGALVAAGRPWDLGGAPVPMRMGDPAEPGSLRASVFPSEDGMYAGIAKEIDRRVAGGGSPGDFAILARSNVSCDAAQAALDAAGIPAVRLGSRGGPWDQPTAHAVLTWAAVCTQTIGALPKPLDWLPLLVKFPKRTMLGEAVAADVAGALLRTRESPADAVANYSVALRPGQQHESARMLEQDVRRCTVAFASGWEKGLRALAQVFGLPADALDGLPEDSLEATSALDAPDGHTDSGDKSAKAEDAQSPADTDEREELDRAQRAARVTLRAMLKAGDIQASVRAQILGSQTPCFPDAIDPADRARLETALLSRVAVSTIHGAKGKEWRTVFLITPERQFDRGIDGEDGQPTQGWEELQRLLYVGVTRARDELVLMWSGTDQPAATVRGQLLPYFLRERERTVQAHALRTALQASPWAMVEDDLELGEEPTMLIQHSRSGWSIRMDSAGITEMHKASGVVDTWQIHPVHAGDPSGVHRLTEYIGASYTTNGEPAWFLALRSLSEVYRGVLAEQGVQARAEAIAPELAKMVRERCDVREPLPVAADTMAAILCGRDGAVPKASKSIVEATSEAPDDAGDVSDAGDNLAEHPLVLPEINEDLPEAGSTVSDVPLIELASDGALVDFVGSMGELLPPLPWQDVQVANLPWTVQIAALPGEERALFARLASHSDALAYQPVTQRFAPGTLLLFHAVDQVGGAMSIYAGILRVVTLLQGRAGLEWVSFLPPVEDAEEVEVLRSQLNTLLHHAVAAYPLGECGYLLTVLTGPFDLFLSREAQPFLVQTGNVRIPAPPSLGAVLRDRRDVLRDLAMEMPEMGISAHRSWELIHREGPRRSTIDIKSLSTR